MSRIIHVGRIYRHYKGDHYLVEAIATHSETLEKMVIYRQLYGKGEMFARPYDMFAEELDRAKYPNAKQKYRFELVNAKSVANH